MDYYFNQLMEIQNSTDHSFFLLDQDSEPRFVIEADKRTIIIPAEFQFLGVKTDQCSEKIYFEVDRIFDDVDLSTKTCVIQYINAGTDDVDEGIYPVTELDTTTVPGKIVFKWEVDNIVCKYAGVVAFSVRFYEIDPETKLYTYCWNTIPENLPVLDGLNVSGSVTEDFPTELLEWNARMAALNTEITNKISTADATMKADLKTAKGYMDGAQAARGGAEDAESRVQAIVAGNESYTKQQSHDLFALALRGTAEAAKSITIYPDKGSNVVATINGFTKQSGSGDPSPTNVRALTNGGLKLVKVVFDGTENWSQNSSSVNTGYLYLRITAAANSSHYAISNILGFNYGYGGNGVFAADNYLYFGAAFGKQYTLDTWKAMLAARYAAGDPVIVWYQPADESDGTGSLYAPIILEGGEYRATCLPLTAPLCEGDSVVSWARSGCDKVVTFDGSEDEKWLPFSGAAGIFYIDLTNAKKMSHTLPVITDRLYYVSRGDVYTEVTYGDFSTQYLPGIIRLIIRADDSSTDSRVCRTYIATHPITVWYRSTNYTEADDIAVSLETHKNAYLEYLVANMNNLENYPGWANAGVLGIVGGNISANVPKAACNFAKNVYANTLHRQDIIHFYGIGLQSQIKSTYPDVVVQVTIPYKTPITYAHPAVVLPALPDDTGKVTITGEADGTVSAEYNKDITYAFSELQSAILALGANLSL